MAFVRHRHVAGLLSPCGVQSWHWESRNYNKFAEEALRRRLSSVVVTDDTRATVRVASVPDLKAEATINIRKGKKILVFETSFTVKWEGQSTDGASTKVVKGDAKVFELMQDDVEDEFEVRITIDGSTTDTLDASCKELMRTRGASEVRRHLREFSKELLEHDGGQEKLALDAKRRSEEAAKTATAVVETSAEKARIAKEQSEKEAKRKTEEAVKAQEREALKPADAPKKVEAASGSGSLWNVNSYHWEEKPLTVWAKERLNELVKGFHIHIPGGHIKIVNVELNGDASCSIRKGKKLTFFDFKIKAQWEGELVDSEGEVIGTGDGELEIPELDQDCDGSYEIRLTAAEDGGVKDAKLQELFRSHGLKAFREKLAIFVQEVKARG